MAPAGLPDGRASPTLARLPAGSSSAGTSTSTSTGNGNGAGSNDQGFPERPDQHWTTRLEAGAGRAGTPHGAPQSR
ncbi:hypothetical protein CC117_04490 [Parafrankia colletiae]|uniref:Uncharacterized protein n=1 Tax=Parafrankia colletiae TaxID=573497 RepID=A0A1S1QRD0_9ACTN|nr:hypothetical protein CC117_04490 [Parafrankia colletiae]